MDDPAYIVNNKACKGCMYYCTDGLHCCNYTPVTGKARPQEPVAQCSVKKKGRKARIPSTWGNDIKGGLAVRMD